MQIPSIEIEKQKVIMQAVRERFSQIAKTEPLAYVDTYGCQQNESDSEKIRGMLLEMGYGITPDEHVADVIVVNTCAIRENAENRVFGNVGDLRHTKKAKPSQIIAICGCMAAIAENVERLRKTHTHVSMTFTPADLWRFPELLYQVLRDMYPTSEEKEERAKTRTQVKGKSKGKGKLNSKSLYTLPRSEYAEARIAEGLPTHRDMKVKAWLPIMHGCNNFCSYCIVPYVRGREVSRKPEAILTEARELVSQGYKDITLLGQNVNSYNPDIQFGSRNSEFGIKSFPDLIRQINKIDGEFLIRFMTSHPKDATKELFSAMAESEKAARHIHLPFQAGSDRILKKMNRGYTSGQYLDIIGLARKSMPDIVITSDVIVGFPGETEEDFEDTLRLVEAAQFEALFTFIYSKRPSTSAAKLEDTVTREQKQVRFDRLIEMQNSISDLKHAEYVGKIIKVLVDDIAKDDDTYALRARTNGGRLVHMRGKPEIVGKFVEAKIEKSTTWALFGNAECRMQN
jgi:tRNA-2-methylthio-N6-dimethylallyladenosine synthase